MVTGLLIDKLPFVPANALEANSNANPSTRLFDTVANFMTAPFFFPEITSGNGWGGPVHDFREKTLVFCRESPTIQPLGFQPTSRKACHAVDGGCLTWAAKPRVRESPKPRKNSASKKPAS